MLVPRLQLEVGSRAELEEAGVWYPVRVIRAESTKVLVHFEGWSPRHDRWIDRESKNIRARRREMLKRKRRLPGSSAANSDEDTVKERDSRKDKDTPKEKAAGCSTSAPRERRSTAGVGQGRSSQRRDSTTPGTKLGSGSLQRRVSAPVGRRSSTGQPLKVGGVFRAGIRRTARKSVDQGEEKEAKEKDAAPVENQKETKQAKPTQDPVPATPAPAAAPPVGWAYEVVTKAEDLVPKKAFTISEDHNEFKCTQPDCNKGFRKQKLLASHLKHYHNISADTEQVPTKAQLPKRTTLDSADNVGEDQPAKRRRGRRSRSEIEEALRNKEQQDARTITSETGTPVNEAKELVADLATESSSSTDISNATIVDHLLDPIDSAQQPSPSAPVGEASTAAGQSDASAKQPSVQAPAEAGVAAPGTPITAATPPAPSAAVSPTSAVPTTPALPPKTPLYGRVGQNRFVPIPEPLVLGREKRKVVKTERFQEAEGVLLRRITQPRTPNVHGDAPAVASSREGAGQKEGAHSSRDRRRKSHPDSVQHKEKPPEDVVPPPMAIENLDPAPKPEQALSEDEEPVATPVDRSLPSTGPGSAQLSPHAAQYRTPSDTLVEKDMVHCLCDVDEESGLMMQCDICLCWQHGSCFGIESEQLVPERYVCVACANARRVWAPQAQKQAAFRAMTEGRLPGLAPGLPPAPSPRFINLARVTEVMDRLKRGMLGVERRVERIARDSSIPAVEKRILLAMAAGDVEHAHRQLDACERIVEAIDRPAGDGGACGGTSEALILRSTVKSVLKDLAAVQRLTLYK